MGHSAILVVGLIISIVAAIFGEETVRTMLFAVGFFLLLGGIVVVDNVRRRRVARGCPTPKVLW
jgi:FtsH-binding integral membrane protein